MAGSFNAYKCTDVANLCFEPNPTYFPWIQNEIKYVYAFFHILKMNLLLQWPQRAVLKEKWNFIQIGVILCKGKLKSNRTVFEYWEMETFSLSIKQKKTLR